MNTPEDDAYEFDIVTVERAIAEMKRTFVQYGLWKDGEGMIEVRVNSRLGTPIEMDSY